MGDVETRLLIPVTLIIEGKEKKIIVEGKEFDAVLAQPSYFFQGKFGNMNNSFTSCQLGGFQPLFMTSIVDARNEPEKILDIWNEDYHIPDTRIWCDTYFSVSAKILGRTTPSNISRKNGTPVEVYTHAENFLSDYKNIEEILKSERLVRPGKSKWMNLVIYPIEHFKELLANVDGKKIFEVNHTKAKKWPNGAYGIDKPTKEHMKEYGGKIDGTDMIAINHPRAIPFFGGKERAQKYLARHADLARRIFDEHAPAIPFMFHNENHDSHPTAALLCLGRIFASYEIGSKGEIFSITGEGFGNVRELGPDTHKAFLYADRSIYYEIAKASIIGVPKQEKIEEMARGF